MPLGKDYPPPSHLKKSKFAKISFLLVCNCFSPMWLRCQKNSPMWQPLHSTMWLLWSPKYFSTMWQQTVLKKVAHHFSSISSLLTPKPRSVTPTWAGVDPGSGLYQIWKRGRYRLSYGIRTQYWCDKNCGNLENLWSVLFTITSRTVWWIHIFPGFLPFCPIK